MSLLSFVGKIFEPAAKLIDDLHTSEDEKLTHKAILLQQKAEFLEYALDYEKEQLQAKTAIILAETKSESWITRNWRPVTMLAFVGATLGYWFGLTPAALPEAAVLSMFGLVKIGLGGYVVGRSAEKVVPGIVKAFNKKDET
jgi:hypothetical protein